MRAGHVTVREVGALGDHAAAWDALVDAMPLPSPFLRSWWLDHTAVGEPCLALAFDGDELVGGLALQRSLKAGVEWLEALGAGPLEPDHLDLVAAPERAPEVIAAVRTWLGRRGDCVVDLAGLRAAAWALDAVPGWGEVTPLDPAPYVTLPASADDVLARLDGRMRSTVKRSAKRLAKAGIEHRVVDATSPAADVDAALAALHELHDGRWGTQSGFLAAWAGFEAAARAGIAAGEVVVHQLTGPDGIVAVEVELVVAGRVSFYQAGRRTDHDLRGSGSVLRFEAIAASIAAGCTEFDLLRGDEDYKAAWADRRRSLWRLRRGIGPRGRLVVAAARANVALQRRRQQRAEGPQGDGADAAASATAARIVLYTDAAQIGGAESVAKALLGGLDERFSVVVVGTDVAVVDDIAAVRPSASTLVLPPITDRRDVGAMVAHRRALRSLRPDIFHANLSEGSSCQYALLAALSVPGLRVVVTENSPMGVRSELSRRIKQRSAPRFDAHVGVGRRAAALVEGDLGLPAGTLRVIPNGVPVVEHPEPAPRTGRPTVVAVSRFDPVKGLDVAVRAMAEVDGPARLVVYGDGPERARLEALVDELGLRDRVELAGWVDDVRRRLVDADLFVLPSRLEGMPMSLLEAMQAGVASVATDVGSVAEVIEDGVSGRVVAPDDPGLLAAAIDELLADDELRAKIAAAGREVALARFTSAANVAAYEALYDEVLARPARRRRGGSRRRGFTSG